MVIAWLLPMALPFSSAALALKQILDQAQSASLTPEGYR